VAYDPADLKLPHWLLRSLDALVAIHIPLGFGWWVGFTRPGIIFIAALLGVWAAALYSGNNLLYLCGAMMTAITAAAIVQAARLLKRFPDLGPLLPLLQVNSVTVLRKYTDLQEPASAVVGIEWHCVEECFSLRGRCEGDRVRLEGKMKPQSRGIYRCSKLLLSSDAPLGLFLLALERRGKGEVVVMPEPAVWNPDGHNGNNLSGQQLNGGDEWLDLRGYVPGDSLSRVHWRKASGDIREWKVKRFASEMERPHERLLRVDLRMPAGASAAAFERLLARVWFWVLEQGSSGQLILGQDSFDLGNSAQSAALQRAIAAAHPESLPASGEGGLLLTVSDDS